MRILTEKAKSEVQQVIDDHIDELRSIPNFVSAEPGVPFVDAIFLTEPAVIVSASNKVPRSHLFPEERAPHQLGPCRVTVMQADPIRELAATEESLGIAAAAAMRPESLTYRPIEGNPIDQVFKLRHPCCAMSGLTLAGLS
jgi:hypothetical protein